MRVIAHISDLHFGRADNTILAALRAQVIQGKPDVVAVSGDLTQRARTHEFLQARAFLDSLPFIQIVVPGNHDIPLRNPIQRVLRPLAKYRRYICDNLEPFYCDEEIAIVGVNTSQAIIGKEGIIKRQQVARACERLNEMSGQITKFVVAHHPFDLPLPHRKAHVVRRAAMAMGGFAGCGVDLLLSGHLHASHATAANPHYAKSGPTAILVQAGTAASTRTRGEPNSWNLICVEWPRITVEVLTWEPAKHEFKPSQVVRFRRTPIGWSVLPTQSRA